MTESDLALLRFPLLFPESCCCPTSAVLTSGRYLISHNITFWILFGKVHIDVCNIHQRSKGFALFQLRIFILFQALMNFIGCKDEMLRFFHLESRQLTAILGTLISFFPSIA